jgi:hypothetical protein
MKGFWVYLKLNESIPTDEIELLNRGLEVLLDADRCHNRDRIARLLWHTALRAVVSET